MLLIGVNRSPYTRRVAIALEVYGMDYEMRPLSGFGDRLAVRAHNPLGRIPTLVLDDGEALVDSFAILDHLDEVHGRDRALCPAAGPERRAVLRAAALAVGACEKLLQAAYERNHRPPEKVHEPWREDCIAQAEHALDGLERLATRGATHLLLDRPTHADIAAAIAERLARAGFGVDTAARFPRLHALGTLRHAEPAFRATEP